MNQSCGIYCASFTDYVWTSCRRDELPSFLKGLESSLYKLVFYENVTDITLNLELGVPFFVAETLLKFRESKKITIRFVLPYLKEISRWNELHKKQFSQLKSKANQIIVFEESVLSKSTMNIKTRYKYIVDNTSFMIVIDSGTSAVAKKVSKYSQNVNNNTRVIAVVRNKAIGV